MSTEDHKTDQIPELSPHYSETHCEDQSRRNSLRMDPLLELELAKVRLAHIEKEIELEQLRQKGKDYCNQIQDEKFMSFDSASVSRTADNAGKGWVGMISKALDLPKREIIRFDGHPMNYWSFIRNFEDCFDESVGPRSKLNFLIQYCDGEAKATIVHCTLLQPEEGYRKALELFEEEFGQKHVVFPAIKEIDSNSLRRLAREMYICELTLTQMNYLSDLNSTKTIESMLLKLPPHLQREWVKIACRILKTGREPLFNDLCEFVKEQSDIANTRYGLLVNRSDDVDKRGFDALKGKAAASYNIATVAHANSNDSNTSLHNPPCPDC
ncbi:unnamed protein product [Schistosoma turkestanicum]|nr:unnamed protein product [Schistosoma turkestanicum]